MANSYDSAQFITQDPGAYRGTYLGTAAGTTLISNVPTFISHIQILQRVASGTIAIFDSGTNTNPLGTFILGTQTNTDPPNTIILKHNTKTALTIANSANIQIYVAYLP